MTSLGAIGLGPDEEALYEVLLDRSPATLAELATAWPRADLQPLLASLEAKGLLSSSPGPPPAYAAVAPEMALDVLLLAAERDLLRVRERARELEEIFQERARERTPPVVVEVVTGRRAVEQRHAQIQRAARQQLRCLSRRPYFDPLGSVAAQRELLERGISSRMIYERDFVAAEGALRQIEEMVGAGQQARVLPELPMKLYVVDDRLALLLLRHEPADAVAALVIHPSGLLEALITLFEGLWQRALPLGLAPSTRNPPPPRDSRDDARLVALLLSGLTDEAIARQLGVGHRTAERRIAELMSRLGARTRFQAGVQAALSQLPPPPSP
ncbi:helix-turn-helix domain-containing protein [Nonomuraea angiospora]|uniref:Sugar-specific transcriptional regulator TrmB/DNA-binding CsgD family transcriptional regulator n=1 Tax=Nonomuraea angiospora TaxID=46172 RepID=A0ABR9LSJ4_9ACTN|nr:helix-turn-helix domain-containing protein [Nonomuraea angiospora]MBE1583240.1 sugar-specific transcriptional regulator TrmB/DNA-binding CsgD family transcriptional regulator [Nonomuraea angiospora]